MFPCIQFMSADYMLGWCAPDRTAMDAVEGRFPTRRASLNRFSSCLLSSSVAGSPVPAGEDPRIPVSVSAVKVIRRGSPFRGSTKPRKGCPREQTF